MRNVCWIFVVRLRVVATSLQSVVDVLEVIVNIIGEREMSIHECSYEKWDFGAYDALLVQMKVF